MKRLALFLCATGFLSACSSSGSKSSSNELKPAYPTDLAVTSPYGTGAALEGLVKLDPTYAQTSADTAIDPPSYDAKKKAILDKIDGTDISACGLTIRLFSPAPTAGCYGPVIDYQNHPDYVGPGGGLEDGHLPSGDVGIWKEYETRKTGKEACVAAKLNSLLADAQGQIDLALGLVTGLMCAAHAKGADKLPKPGESKDFAAVLKDALGTGADKYIIDTASLEAATSADGTVYTFHIVTSIAVTTPDGTKDIAVDLHLKHVVTDAAAGTYKGRLWYTISGNVPAGAGGCFLPGNVPTAPKLHAASVLYNRNSDTDLKYRLQRATYCSDTAEPFDADDNLDGSNTFDPSTNPGGWASNYNDGVFNLNPADGTGVVSYAWQAGRGDDHARVFLADLTSSGGTPSGCGYFGFGPPATSADVGTIDGMICNWAGPQNDHTPAASVQRQCVKYDAATKLYVTDNSTELNIAYAPENSCSYDGSTGNFGAFEFKAPGDSPNAGAVLSELLDIATMKAAVSVPTKPTGL